jgi:hypothetical protein
MAASEFGSVGLPDRRNAHWRVQEIGVLLMLLLQLAGLIWGAATLKNGADQTTALVNELKNIVREVDQRQRAEEISNARRDGRVDALQGMIAELQKRVMR